MRSTSFRTKLVLLLALAVALAQLATLGAVLYTTRNNIMAQIDHDLGVATGVFTRLLSQRSDALADSVSVLAADFGFKRAAATGDVPTIVSALENHSARAGADVAVLMDLDGHIAASTLAQARIAASPDWPRLSRRAAGARTVTTAAELDGRLYELVGVPVKAPEPIAWLFLGFQIDNAFAQELQELTGLDVSFVSRRGDSVNVGGSSLAAAQRRALPAALDAATSEGVTEDARVALGDERFLVRVLGLDPDAPALLAVLKRSLSEAMAPYREIRTEVIVLFLVALALAIATAAAFARSITAPLGRLAKTAEKIGEGNYATPIEVSGGDEIGTLADTLGRMQIEIGEREKRIVHQATHDELTGLPNRFLVKDRLEGALKRAQRSGHACTLVMLDLVRFKRVNDTFGQHIGDMFLTEFAARLSRRLRRSDTAARIGGDEFLLILEDTGIDTAEQMLRADLHPHLCAPLSLGELTISVDLAAGMVEFPNQAVDAGTLLRRGEIALDDARGSRERLARYQDGRDEGNARQLAIATDLHDALAEGQVALHYQPKATFATGAVAHCEALVRWVHPRLGFLPPDEFIAVLEQTGSITALTEWVVSEAARQCRDWEDRGLSLNLGINLSTVDLLEPDLAERILARVHAFDLPAERFTLEITESALMRDPAHAINTLHELRAAGFALAIDDFGTGYSSLAQLKRLPVQELKIDKSFVLTLQPGSDDAVIVQSTVQLAHSMGIEVVAEGVETETACQLLASFGCGLAQGYFLSKPLPAADFEAWLTDYRRGPNLITGVAA